jgi:outer membrane protein assembly factor BamB
MLRSPAIRLSIALSFAPILSSAIRADDWPQFRGPNRNNISTENGLLRSWPQEGPRVLWRIKVCQGYAGAAIRLGRVYLNDYDLHTKEHWVRCLSLAAGKDIWGWRWKTDVNPQHGFTRSVPAVGEKLVFSLDPNCGFHAIDVKTGKLVWQKLLTKEYKAWIPPWYAGQNPLLDGDRVAVAVGGRQNQGQPFEGDTLAIAFAQDTGKEVWRAQNTPKAFMSHSSLMPATIDGVRQFLYFHMKGTVGIDAVNGEILWSAAFRGKMAVSPSPVAIGDGRVFLTSGYEAGSAMVKVEKAASGFTAKQLYFLRAKEFNSEVHTPVLWQDHLYAVGIGKTKRGLFTCLDLEGNIIWESPFDKGADPKTDRRVFRTFGLGGFLLADGMFFVVEGNSGMLRLIEASTKEYRELASFQALHGDDDIWAPPALSEGKLIVRDMADMVCLQVGR